MTLDKDEMTIDWSDVTRLEATRLRTDGSRIVRKVIWADPVRTSESPYVGSRFVYWINGSQEMYSDSFWNDGSAFSAACRWLIRPASAPPPDSILLPSGERAKVGDITWLSDCWYRVTRITPSLVADFWFPTKTKWIGSGNYFARDERLATPAEIAGTTIPLADVPQAMREEVAKLRQRTIRVTTHPISEERAQRISDALKAGASDAPPESLSQRIERTAVLQNSTSVESVAPTTESAIAAALNRIDAKFDIMLAAVRKVCGRDD